MNSWVLEGLPRVGLNAGGRRLLYSNAAGPLFLVPNETAPCYSSPSAQGHMVGKAQPQVSLPPLEVLPKKKPRIIMY